ncbi:MAG: hypothetical protein AAGE99_05610, partial [Chlamydiota bacterium]
MERSFQSIPGECEHYKMTLSCGHLLHFGSLISKNDKDKFYSQNICPYSENPDPPIECPSCKEHIADTDKIRMERLKSTGHLSLHRIKRCDPQDVLRNEISFNHLASCRNFYHR